MAQSSLVPKNGAVSWGALVADFQAFSLRATQSVENVTPYGNNTCTKNVGNGTPDFNFTISAFALKGTAGANLNLPPSMAATGAAMTLTLDTGVSYACTMVPESIEIQHSRLRAAVPLNISGKNYGDVTETWATT